MQRGMGSVLIERLNSLLKASGMSARSVSMKATGKPDTIRDILRDQTKSPRAITVGRLAAVLGVDSAYLNGETDVPNPQANNRDILQPARVVGVVQAGAFMELEADNRFEIEPQWIPTIKDAEFPNVEQVAFEIAGDSVDKVCAAGGHAVCLPFADTGLLIKAGMYVVAQRTRGGLVELTIKRVEGTFGHYQLVPDSRNPKHKPITFPSAEPGEEVTIIALVRRFISPTLTY